MLTLTHAGLSDKGRVRAENQDRWFGDDEAGLYIVADGIGGGPAGRVAAQVVVDTLPLLIAQKMQHMDHLGTDLARGKLRDCLAQLSERLRTESRGRPGLNGMGSTVVLALIRNGHGLIGHMGDSRAYLLCGRTVTQLTIDHSIVQVLLNEGDITPVNAKRHPARGQLTRYVGMEGDALPDVQHFKPQPGDHLLLCSDGLSSMVDQQQLREIGGYSLGDDEMCARLIAAANEAGGNDNITVLVASWTS